ncbi:MAG: hypothetical protein KAJ37_08245, partial [Candidatus Krumholzibacteria bacterium]|nr:hypothetical protein [Candidatus Krumholzibacteria bacterium]
MKRAMIIACCLVFGASMAFGQAGSVGIFSDVGATSCNFADAGGLVQVYISHVNTTGATASQFMLVPGPGWTRLGDTWNFGTIIGVSTAGVSVAYGGCFSGAIALGVVNFFGSVAPSCTLISIVPDPVAPSGAIEAVDCTLPDPLKMFPTGGSAIVNSDGSCDCLIPVQDATWGGVKALYQCRQRTHRREFEICTQHSLAPKNKGSAARRFLSFSR